MAPTSDCEGTLVFSNYLQGFGDVLRGMGMDETCGPQLGLAGCDVACEEVVGKGVVVDFLAFAEDGDEGDALRDVSM
jgi:hypothetical protein